MEINLDNFWKSFAGSFFDDVTDKPCPEVYETMRLIYYTAMMQGIRIVVKIFISDIDAEEKKRLLANVYEQLERFKKEFIT